MTEALYVFTLLTLAATCIGAVAVWAVGARGNARARASQEDAYRELATTAATAQADAATRLAVVQGELTSVTTRLAAIEKMLSSVE